MTAGGAWKAVRSNIVRFRINSHVQDAGIGMQNLEPTQSRSNSICSGQQVIRHLLSETHIRRVVLDTSITRQFQVLGTGKSFSLACEQYR